MIESLTATRPSWVMTVFDDTVTTEDMDCSICLDNIPPATTIKRLKCKHVFHKKCLKKWVTSSDVCPYCREVIIRTNRICSREDHLTAYIYLLIFSLFLMSLLMIFYYFDITVFGGRNIPIQKALYFLLYANFIGVVLCFIDFFVLFLGMTASLLLLVAYESYFIIFRDEPQR